MSIQITEVRIRLMREPKHDVVAAAAVTFEDAIAVHDILVIRRGEDLLVAMPGRWCADGKRRDLVHPTRSDVRRALVDAVLAAYWRERLRAEKRIQA